MIEVIADRDDGQPAESWELTYADLSDDELALMTVRGDELARMELEQRVRKSMDAEKADKPDLVKVRRRAVDEALARLAEMPDAKPGLIAVPWQVLPRPSIPTDTWADSRLQLLPIESLTATQRFLKRTTVEWHLENLGQVGEGHNSNPNVVLSGDSALIYDGHHRLAAQWLLDVVAMNCWTLEV